MFSNKRYCTSIARRFLNWKTWCEWFIMLPGFLLLPVKLPCIYLELEALPNNRAVHVIFFTTVQLHATQTDGSSVLAELTIVIWHNSLIPQQMCVWVCGCVHTCVRVLLSCHCIPVPLAQIGDLLADNNLIIMTMILLCREYICSSLYIIYRITQYCGAQRWRRIPSDTMVPHLAFHCSICN